MPALDHQMLHPEETIRWGITLCNDGTAEVSIPGGDRCNPFLQPVI
jgi:hypothetical protein